MKIPWSMPDITDWERQVASDVIASGWVTMGEETAKFQEELEKEIGCDHVVVVNNGTSALLGAILAHEAKGVVVPAYSYQSTLNAPSLLGKYIIFRDVDSETVLMKPPEVGDVYQEKCYFIPVSYAGMPISEEWEYYPVIEDGAESFGAKTRKAKTGAQGWTTTFSFHAAKLITTVEGGAVATNDEKIYQRLLTIRNNGEHPKIKGEFIRAGLNLKPTDISSAIGRVQLKKLTDYLDNRFKVSLIYEKGLGDLVGFQHIPDYVERHANMMFPVFIQDPCKLAEELRKKGISTRLGWAPLSPKEGARWVFESVICLPIFNTMTAKQAEYVVEAVQEALQ